MGLDPKSKIQRVELYLENRIQVDLILGFGLWKSKWDFWVWIWVLKTQIEFKI
jgi:hypothetical protein